MARHIGRLLLRLGLVLVDYVALVGVVSVTQPFLVRCAFLQGSHLLQCLGLPQCRVLLLWLFGCAVQADPRLLQGLHVQNPNPTHNRKIGHNKHDQPRLRHVHLHPDQSDQVEQSQPHSQPREANDRNLPRHGPKRHPHPYITNDLICVYHDSVINSEAMNHFLTFLYG